MLYSIDSGSKMIKVSILCNAYNHGKYIRKCLDGFVMQKTDFEYEVLIHDDASTDDTATIIKEYEKKYPEIIKPIYQKENQYSRGISIYKIYQYPRIKGNFVALCEGDDYWCDSNKLQAQVDALENHPEIDMCAHKTYICQNGKIKGTLGPDISTGILSLDQVILGGGGYLSTNSLLYRRKVNDSDCKFRNFYRIDYSLQILGAIKGGIFYLDKCMSAYNYMTQGSWTLAMVKDSTKHLKQVDKTIEMLGILDEETLHTHSSVINQRVRQLEFYKCLIKSDYKNIKIYHDLYSQLSLREKAKLLLKYFIKKIYK